MLFKGSSEDTGDTLLDRLIGRDRLSGMDRVERVLLREVVDVCGKSRSLSEAGRTLYAATRARKKSANDADRLRKYLARYGLKWQDFAT